MNINIETNDALKCAQALKGLYFVDDPEVGLNVVDLGLIYTLNFDEEAKNVDAIMTLTSQFCPMGESITSNIMQTLSDAFPEWYINLHLTFEPPWDSSKISEKGKEFLGQ
ncbi:MAG TPA: metal-sulfur cluster assembly factor [Chitinophagales bacterium]|jgi:metal-sulfur cluster biosynthetic enzyme|nr:metal-sulfur cluster assembly factor [Chitinophagales bacterium]HQW77965.1 metal-sulfur cluster assembly factor [Chitinophagales bacterium]HRB66797.1 metal-sulfur cluster assembly factor [Chitinophagales bacterium]HRB68521.1 metal-sulfur cluster assembly factor [Chitinophagales bacterium]HRB92137.1 metal-sulfur cluster assembly factor [Chitinophagales bacterium]